MVLARWLNPFSSRIHGACRGQHSLVNRSWHHHPPGAACEHHREICVGFALVGWHAKRFQHVLRPIMTTVLLSSIIFVLLDPADAIHPQ